MSKEIKSKECKFVHSCGKGSDGVDVHLVKEIIHYTDGTSEPNKRIIKGFKRPYYIVKPEERNFFQKKEWIDKNRCDRYMCQESDLKRELKRHTGIRSEKIREIKGSPYVYGTDKSAEALIKEAYRKKYGSVFTKYRVACLDTETDVIKGTNETIISTISMGSKQIIVVSRDFLGKCSDPHAKVEDAIAKYLPEFYDRTSLEVYIEDSEMDIWVKTFKRLHELQPDIVAIWNMLYDIEKAEEACKRAGVNPKYLFSDPELPGRDKGYYLKKGLTKRVTATGAIYPIPWHRQWHTILSPASFVFIDAACMFSITRVAGGQMPGGYSLDNVLKKIVKRGKLKFSKADKYHKLKWHQVMQENYKPEYCAYALFDVIGMTLLDDKTIDLSTTIGTFSKDTAFNVYNSQVKRLADLFHDHVEEQGYALGAVGCTDVAESYLPEHMKKMTALSLRDWIAVLPAYLMENDGIRIVKEDANIVTNFRAYVQDCDCISSYPSDIDACNVSKETCLYEVSEYYGVDDRVARYQNMNLISGHVNALEYGAEMLGIHSNDLLKEYREEHK